MIVYIPLRDNGMLCLLQGTLFSMMLLAVSSINDGDPTLDETVSVVCWADVWLSRGLVRTGAEDNNVSISDLACICYLHDFTEDNTVAV